MTRITGRHANWSPPQASVGSTRQDALLIGGFLLAFLAIAKFAHFARPALVIVLVLGVFLLGRRSFHLGVSVYALSFPFLAIMPKQLFGIAALNPPNLMLLALGSIVLFRAVRPESEGPEPTNPQVYPALFLAYGWALVGMVIAWARYGIPLDYGMRDWRSMVAVSIPLVFGAFVASQGQRPRAFLAGVSLVSVATINLWGVIEYFGDLAGGADPDRIRFGGRFGQANNFGTFQALALPGFVVLAGGGKSMLLRASGWVGMLLCLANLASAASRGAVLSAAMGFFIVGVLRHRAILATVLLVAVIFGATVVPDAVLNRFQTTFSGEEAREGLDSSTYTRRELYRIAPDVFLQHPVFGGGWASFPNGALRLGRPELARSPHSFYIQVLTELGLVGFLLFGWLTICSIRGIWRRLRRATCALDGLMATAMLGSTGALAMSCFFLKPFVDNDYVLPLYFLGLGLTLGIRAPGRLSGITRTRRRFRPDPISPVRSLDRANAVIGRP